MVVPSLSCKSLYNQGVFLSYVMMIKVYWVSHVCCMCDDHDRCMTTGKLFLKLYETPQRIKKAEDH